MENNIENLTEKDVDVVITDNRNVYKGILALTVTGLVMYKIGKSRGWNECCEAIRYYNDGVKVGKEVGMK